MSAPVRQGGKASQCVTHSIDTLHSQNNAYTCGAYPGACVITPCMSQVRGYMQVKAVRNPYIGAVCTLAAAIFKTSITYLQSIVVGLFGEHNGVLFVWSIWNMFPIRRTLQERLQGSFVVDLKLEARIAEHLTQVQRASVLSFQERGLKWYLDGSKREAG